MLGLLLPFSFVSWTATEYFPHLALISSRFVEVLGLKTLFAAFMKKGAKAMKKSYKENFSETEEEGKDNLQILRRFKHLRPKKLTSALLSRTGSLNHRVTSSSSAWARQAASPRQVCGN